MGLKLISAANWLPSMLWRCWFGHLACKNRPKRTYKVSSGTLSLYSLTLYTSLLHFIFIGPSKDVFQVSSVSLNKKQNAFDKGCTASNDLAHMARGVHCTRRRRLPLSEAEPGVIRCIRDRQDTANIGNNSLHLVHSTQPKNSCRVFVPTLP